MKPYLAESGRNDLHGRNRALVSSEAQAPAWFTLQVPPLHPGRHALARRDAVATALRFASCAERDLNPHVLPDTRA
jgi:hypothetical protein